jgi:hypothetical protein
VTTPSAKADGSCLVAAAFALTTAPQALRTLHPATLTPASPVQAQDHLTTRMFYGNNDLSGFARFPLPTPRNILFSKALVIQGYHGVLHKHLLSSSNGAPASPPADVSFPCRLQAAVP